MRIQDQEITERYPKKSFDYLSFLYFMGHLLVSKQTNVILIFHVYWDYLYLPVPPVPTCTKVIMQGKLFQRCKQLLYCSVLSLGGNVNTRRMSNPDIGSIFHLKKQLNIHVIENYYVNYQNYKHFMLLTSSDTKFLFTNSAQRELVPICTQSIRNCN